MMGFERYWLFAALCVAVALVMFRMVIKERVTLQASLSFLLVLLLTIGVALFPEGAHWVAVRMHFTLVSNFFLAVAVGALAFLHLAALVHLSRVQLRSVALTQELALVQEKLDRALNRLEQQQQQTAVGPR
jgi:phosphoglycerol transferase MdoB-like AlkP superfamily enzyme